MHNVDQLKMQLQLLPYTNFALNYVWQQKRTSSEHSNVVYIKRITKVNANKSNLKSQPCLTECRKTWHSLDTKNELLTN